MYCHTDWHMDTCTDTQTDMYWCTWWRVLAGACILTHILTHVLTCANTCTNTHSKTCANSCHNRHQACCEQWWGGLIGIKWSRFFLHSFWPWPSLWWNNGSLVQGLSALRAWNSSLTNMVLVRDCALVMAESTEYVQRGGTRLEDVRGQVKLCRVPLALFGVCNEVETSLAYIKFFGDAEASTAWIDNRNLGATHWSSQTNVVEVPWSARSEGTSDTCMHAHTCKHTHTCTHSVERLTRTEDWCQDFSHHA